MIQVIMVSVDEVRVGRRHRWPKEQSVRDVAASIEKIGLINPITITEDRRLIAGNHRLRAFRLLGRETIPAIVRDVTDLEAELAEIDENLMRAELTVTELSDHYARRKQIYLALHPETRQGYGPGRGHTEKKRHDVVSFAADTSAKTGKERRTVERLVSIGEKIAKPVQTMLKKAVEAVSKQETEVPDKTTETLAKLADNQKELTALVKDGKETRPPADQKAILETMAERGLHRVADAVRELAREGISVEVDLPDGVQLLVGDFRATLKEWPDNSIDLVFADPPYAQKDLPLYAAMAEVAIRVLKPQGNLLCYVGHYAIAEVIDLMTKAGLRYWWLMCVKHAGGRRALEGKRVYVEWKPLLWFVKDTVRGNMMVSDFHQSQAPDKTDHAWAQSPSEARYYIQHLTDPEGVVLDPFCGSGTTGMAALAEGRRAVLCEIDPVVAGKAKEDLAALVGTLA